MATELENDGALYAGEDLARWEPESPFTEWEGDTSPGPGYESYDEADVLEAPLAEYELTRAQFGGAPATPSGQPGARIVAGSFYVQVVGANQDAIAGASTSRGHEGWILGTGFDYEVRAPRDAASGLASGKRQHGPVVLTAPWSSASLQLFQALVTNEVLRSVTFEFPGLRPDGVELIAQRVTLANASISDLRRTSDPTLANHTPIERIAFTFQRITIEDLVSSRSVQDAWSTVAHEFEVEEAGAWNFGAEEEGESEGWVAETYELEGADVRRSDNDIDH